MLLKTSSNDLSATACKRFHKDTRNRGGESKAGRVQADPVDKALRALVLSKRRYRMRGYSRRLEILLEQVRAIVVWLDHRYVSRESTMLQPQDGGRYDESTSSGKRLD